MQFSYIAKTKQGETQSGLVEASTSRGAIESLQAKGWIILRLEESRQAPIYARQLKIFQRVKQKELVNFARQLSILFSAQVPLLESLHALSRQTQNSYFQKIILDIADDVEGGTILSKAFARHPKQFSVFFINMVRSGEASGSLENALQYLADYMEKQHYLISRVRGAMIYPAFITSAFLLIGTLMMILVVPQLTSFIEESGQELPFTTKILIGTSDFLRGWWWFLAIALISGISYLVYSIKHSLPFRRRWHAFLLKIPVFGKTVLQKMYLARFADNLSTLIQGGLTILQALQVSSEVVGNLVFAQIITEAKEEVRIGNTLSSALAKHEQIPPLVSQMIATGEKTGSIDVILKKMAQFYNKEVDNTVDNLSQLIEPILILLIGGAVAILVASILMPIYNVANSM